MTTAKEVTFVNTGTTLTATEVQGALGQVMFRLNYDRDRIGTLENTSMVQDSRIDSLTQEIDHTNAELSRKTDELRTDVNFTNSQLFQLMDRVNMLSTRVAVLESKVG